MEDEKIAVEEEIKPTRRKARAVTVRVVTQKGKSALVEWAEGGDLRRAFVPADRVEGDRVDAETLEASIPYGVPWAELVDLSAATPENFQAEMHRHGVWTVADLESKPKVIRRVTDIITGINLGALHGAARKYEQGG
jgi:hypothetical protein